MLKTAQRMLGDWALGSQIRKIDEWLLAKAKLTDGRMGLVVALATHQRHELDASFSCDFLRPTEVLTNHPTMCSRLEGMLSHMHRNDQPLALTGTVPWLFTLQAVFRPALYGRGVDIWRQMQRGMPHVNDRVAEMGDAGASLNLIGFDEYPKGFRP